MAALVVDVKSREMIKPSSPTPHHPKTLQLSFLDQLQPPIYVHFILFYSNEPNHSINHTKLSTILKKSLSDVLIRFYPLAGRIEGNISIDCNDEGAQFNETHVASDLSKFIENPNLEDLRGLLPFDPVITSNKSTVLGIQVNNFSCGGIAISVCIPHNLVDAKAAVDFVQAWAMATVAAQRGGADNSDDHNVLAVPKFDAASLFPPRDLNGIFKSEPRICKEKVVTKIFIFDKKKIDVLKEQAATSSGLVNRWPQIKAPTRVEVVSAFIWKHLIEADRAKPSPAKISIAIHSVNMRSRRVPPIPAEYFGNFCWFAAATSVIEGDAKHSELVGKLGEAIRKIDNDYIKKIENDGCLLELKKLYENTTNRDVEFCFFSSWSGFPFYHVNFGWGKPLWVSSTPAPIKNMVMLLGTKCGEGIEAWVTMIEDDIAILERDYERL